MSASERPDQPTMPFEIWPYLMLIEGPVRLIGALLLVLYDDARLDRSRWTVDHTMRSRRTYAEHLKRSGLASRRQGIGAKDAPTVQLIQSHCARFGLDCHFFGKGQTTA